MWLILFLRNLFSVLLLGSHPCLNLQVVDRFALTGNVIVRRLQHRPFPLLPNNFHLKNCFSARFFQRSLLTLILDVTNVGLVSIKVSPRGAWIHPSLVNLDFLPVGGRLCHCSRVAVTVFKQIGTVYSWDLNLFKDLLFLGNPFGFQCPAILPKCYHFKKQFYLYFSNKQLSLFSLRLI